MRKEELKELRRYLRDDYSYYYPYIFPSSIHPPACLIKKNIKTATDWTEEFQRFMEGKNPYEINKAKTISQALDKLKASPDPEHHRHFNTIKAYCFDRLNAEIIAKEQNISTKNFYYRLNNALQHLHHYILLSC